MCRDFQYTTNKTNNYNQNSPDETNLDFVWQIRLQRTQMSQESYSAYLLGKRANELTPSALSGLMYSCPDTYKNIKKYNNYLKYPFGF